MSTTILGHFVSLPNDLLTWITLGRSDAANACTSVATGEITVNEALLALPLELQELIIAHEEGHQMYDVQTYGLLGEEEYLKNRDVDFIEARADAYAARRVGLGRWLEDHPKLERLQGQPRHKIRRRTIRCINTLLLEGYDLNELMRDSDARNGV